MGIAAVVAALFLPTTYHHIIRSGTDTFNAHQSIFGDKIITQEIIVDKNFIGAGFILVNLRKAPQLPDVTVTFLNTEGTPVGEQSIASTAIQDDTFAWAYLPLATTLPDNKVRVQITSPLATNTNPIGIRFDADTKEIALALARQVPLWQQLPLWVDDHPDLARHLTNLFIGTSLITGAFIVISLGARLSKTKAALGIILLIAVALMIRLPLIEEIDSVFGGDAFNYFFKANAWVTGHDPFAADARKAPLYSLLLIPGLLMPDPLIWGRLLNITFAASLVAVLPLIVLSLNTPVAIALAAGLLTAVNRQLWWESGHSLANMLYTTLITTSILGFIWSVQKQKSYLLGVIAALTTLTRYEGLPVAAILIPATWLYQKFNVRNMVRSLVPLLILLAIPFSLWPINQQLGVRSWSDIEADGGLGLARSWDDFEQNITLYRGVIARVWVFTPYAGNQGAAAGLGIMTALVLLALHHWQPKVHRYLQLGAPYIIIGTVSFLLVRNNGDVLKHISLILTYITGVGAGFFILRFTRYAIPILLVFISQSLIITWILPKDRYYIQIIPLLALALVYGLYAFSGWHANKKANLGIVICIGLIASLVYFDSRYTLFGLIDEYNTQSQETTVQLKAARFLKRQPGQVALASDYLPLRLYVGDSRLQIPSSDQAADILSWLTSQQVKYVMEINTQPTFTEVIAANPEAFEKVAEFTTEYGSATADIYRFQVY